MDRNTSVTTHFKSRMFAGRERNTLSLTQTINGVTYLNMLKGTFHDDTHPDEWFQQDGATAHTAGEVMAWLNVRFSRRLISHRSEFQWPPRSPDLSPLDFYLWGIC